MTSTMLPFLALPEELIREVLSHVIDVVTDREFFSLDANRGRHGYGGNKPARWSASREMRSPEHRPPALLLVSKDWQRICTPLLYRTAIIRSKGQAEALTTTITSLRPELAARVKRLRFEGAFGMEGFRLLKATTNLTHLALVLHIFATEGVAPLCRGLKLPHISPRVLVVADSRQDSKNRKMLIQELAKLIPSWIHLNAVHIPVLDNNYGPATDVSAILESLRRAPSLHTLVFPPSHRPELETLQDLSGNRALRCIYFARSKVNWNDDDSDLEDTANESDYVVDEEIVDDPRLSSICQYDTPGGRPVRRLSRYELLGMRRRNLYIPSSEPEEQEEDEKVEEPAPPRPPLPLLSHPIAVQEKIWQHVFEFVNGWAIDPFYLYNRRPALLVLAHVCKLFRRLTVPRIFSSLRAQSWKSTYRLSIVLEGDPSLGQHTRALSLNNRCDAKRHLAIGRILQYTPNLAHLDAEEHWCRDSTRDNLILRWSLFTTIARIAPAIGTINNIKIAKQFAPLPPKGTSDDQTDASAAPGGSAAAGVPAPQQQQKKGPTEKEISVPLGPLTPFHSLVVLHFDAAVKLQFKKNEVPADIFPRLEDLRFTSCHTSVLRLFTLFELPRLEHLGLFSRSQTGRDAGDFLERHGPKIQELDIQYFPTDSVLEMCTALRTLRILERKPPPGYSAAGWKSDTLTTIKCTEAIPRQIPACRPWGPLLASIDPAQVPQLKTLKMGLSWPSEEREINASFWVPYAEDLLKKGIEIRNNYGDAWVPRVRAHQHKRKRENDD
ncbi:hypothetical protein EV122DRAFT_226912 [Schizophyllum commune]